MVRVRASSESIWMVFGSEYIYPIRSNMLVLVFHVVFDAFIARELSIGHVWKFTSSHPAVYIPWKIP